MSGGMTGIEYKPEDFPHGLRCADCSRLIEEGDEYSTPLTGFSDDIPMTVIVCMDCAATPQPKDGDLDA